MASFLMQCESVHFRVTTNEHRLAGHILTAERLCVEIAVDQQN